MLNRKLLQDALRHLLMGEHGFPLSKHDVSKLGEPTKTTTQTIDGWKIISRTWNTSDGPITEMSVIGDIFGTMPEAVSHYIEEQMEGKTCSVDGNKHLMHEAMPHINYAKEFFGAFMSQPLPAEFEEEVTYSMRARDFWTAHQRPDYDARLVEAIDGQEFEIAAKLRDDKYKVEQLEEALSEKLVAALEKRDFVAIDNWMAVYKDTVRKIY